MHYVAKKGLFAVFGIMVLFLIGGCAKYRPHHLKQPADFVIEQENVVLKAELLSNEDCYYYFSRRAVSKGYQPVQLSVRNNSSQTYILNAENIDLPIASRETVARALRLDVAGRVIGWAIPGLFLWPFLIAAGVEGVKASDANKKLDRDFEQRVLSYNGHVTLSPGAQMNKVFFVHEDDMKYSFDVVLINKQSQQSLPITIEL